MNRSFRMRTSDNTLAAIIPNRWIWDLVEYLAFRRVQVTCTYRAQQFIVHFPRMKPDQLQELLKRWAEGWPDAESSAADQKRKNRLAAPSGRH
jgi:hypothetical protein